MALLCERTGRLTAKNGGFRPGQILKDYVTKEATTSKTQIDIATDIVEDSVIGFLNLIAVRTPL